MLIPACVTSERNKVPAITGNFHEGGGNMWSFAWLSYSWGERQGLEMSPDVIGINGPCPQKTLPLNLIIKGTMISISKREAWTEGRHIFQIDRLRCWMCCQLWVGSGWMCGERTSDSFHAQLNLGIWPDATDKSRCSDEKLYFSKLAHCTLTHNF